jgi:hypothetical protein
MDFLEIYVKILPIPCSHFSVVLAFKFVFKSYSKQLPFSEKFAFHRVHHIGVLRAYDNRATFKQIYSPFSASVSF